MTTFDQFRNELKALVEKCDALLEQGPLAFKGKPEPITKQRLIEPLLRALNYDVDRYLPEEKIGALYGPVLGWVDYGLQPEPPVTAAFVEAKGLFDKDLWEKHQGQVRSYIRDYLLTLESGLEPVRWVVVTNFAELHILNIMDRHPYLRLTHDQYIDNAGRLWGLLERDNLKNDLIFADYSESRRQSLGKEFLQDLKRWRLILANGYRASTPALTVDEAKALSQQMLDRLILVRVLETSGLQPCYSMVRQFEHWRRFTRNKDKLPFYDELQRAFVDLELDLNTELFKDDLRVAIQEMVKARGQPADLAIPNEFLAALIVPEEPWTDRVRALLKGTQLQLTYTTPYHYDFRTLTDDVVGAVYEQFLAHELLDSAGTITVESSAELRQREGAYYTPTPVVRYLVDKTVGHEVARIREEALALIELGEYAGARAAIERLSNIRVVDIACGSGAFLIEGFDVLLEGYRRYNMALRERLAKSQEGFAPLFEGGGIIEDEGERVLRDNLFGIDKDGQAVEIAKLNLWLKLLKSTPTKYARSDSKAPARLPELIDNIHVRDSLAPRSKLPLAFEPADHVIVVGNPPWGADLAGVSSELSSYELAQGQYDSYELFIERALELLPEGGRLGYVVPDSILHLPEHEPARKMLLYQTTIEHLIKLGEGVFEDVFRAAVAVVARKGSSDPDHKVSAAIIVKADRTELLHKDVNGQYRKTIDDVERAHGDEVRQARFLDNDHAAFDIYTKEADEPVRAKINARPLSWSTIMWTGRGVEMTKKGLIVQCPSCTTWNNIPRQKKDKTFEKKTCSNPYCKYEFEYDAKAIKATIVAEDPAGFPQSKPFVTGENINRYKILKRLHIDTSRAKTLPKCPACEQCDPTWADITVGKTWHCSNCGNTFGRSAVVRVAKVGINYKGPDFYAPPKLLVRKTGRGIYATIDESDAMTNQVVFIFRLKENLQGEEAGYSLYYVLGVLNSKTMLYEFYKRTADIEWRSFPYLTQKTIKELPIPRIDFDDAKQKTLHDEIAKMAAKAVGANDISPEGDDALESLVMELFGLSPDERTHVRRELAEIERYGALLGSHGEAEGGDEESELPDGAEEPSLEMPV